MNNAGSEEDYTTKEETKNNPQWGEEFDGVEFLHIIEKDQHLRYEDVSIDMSQNDQHYYVNIAPQ